MNILITGGLGYLGSYLGRTLAERSGHRIRLLARRVPPAFEAWRDRFDVVVADVTEAEQLTACCRGCDAVLHLAALDRDEARADPGRALEVSGIGTRNLLEAARLAGVSRVIYFSTIHVYGTGRRTSLDEDAEVRPLDDYAIAHLLGELYCEQAREAGGMAVVRLRLANGYGAPVDRRVDCWSLVVHDLCRSVVERGEIVIRSHGTQTRDFIPTADIHRAVELLLTAAPERIRHSLYHVASGVQLSINEVAERVARVGGELRGGAVPIVHRPTGGPDAGERSPVIDTRRIRELGFEPRPPDFMDGEVRRIFEVLS